ncbi:MAG: 1-acyl-sn-glycerol-3-phosphate acyltransferase [Bacteroidetes bacterium]|nr:1-acyl-sn-glycerol-3-phosphate acyltransferase [Bacteroidota bacterium]
MNPVLLVIYHLLKYVVKAALRVYYSKITATGRPRTRFGTPCIVVSNHPSTLLDPLNAVVEVKSEVFFLANAGLFRNPVAAWLLRKLYCIPIERVQDTGGKPLDNAASFEQSSRHLARGGCLYVAPEGSSFVERRLRKFKTGTARIAFDAESRRHFQLGLTILPVGLNYSDPTQFRSELLKVYGEPIRVANFQKNWEEDQIEAVRTLTEQIEEQLSALIIDTENDAEDQLLR